MFRKLLSALTGALLAISMPAVCLAAEPYEILQVGDEDAWVMELQLKLNETGHLKVPATGYYGTNTQNAVISYQREHGLTVDGKAGPVTRKHIFGDEYEPITGLRIPGQDSVLVSPNANSPATAAGFISDGNQEQSTDVISTQKPADDHLAEASASIAQTASSQQEISAGQTMTSLSMGDKGEAVSALQEMLREYDYYDYGSITGYFGPVTKEAVVRFQHTYGLVEDGVVGPEAQGILSSGNLKFYTLKQGDRGEDVSELQARLKELGYMTGTTTGYYGDVTKSAVERFQEANDIAVDGTAGRDTRAALFSAEAVAAPHSTEQITPSETYTPDAEATVAPEAETVTSREPDELQSTEPANDGEAATSAAPTSAREGLDRFVSLAESLVGKPYVYGAVGPNSFDCSGFVYYALKGAGVGVSRLSSAGYAAVSTWETVTSKDDLKRGDLVFFRSDSGSSISHVGIYLGGGNFIHAAPSLDGVGYSTMSSGYYSRNFQTAKRVFG